MYIIISIRVIHFVCTNGGEREGDRENNKRKILVIFVGRVEPGSTVT